MAKLSEYTAGDARSAYLVYVCEKTQDISHIQCPLWVEYDEDGNIDWVNYIVVVGTYTSRMAQNLVLERRRGMVTRISAKLACEDSYLSRLAVDSGAVI